MKSSMRCNNRVFVCGAGHQGLSMAAHLALNGIEVTLWNRTEQHISEIINTGVIHCNGVTNGDAVILKASACMKDVVSDFVMVTTPSTAHKDVARELSPFVHKNMVVILNPGRTFGAIEFVEELKRYGVKELPHVAETQTIVYTCRKSGPNSTNIIALKKDVLISALKGSNLQYILSSIPECLKPYFVPVKSVAITSLSNIGMVLHCAPVLMNIGWIESKFVDFRYYYDGISESVASFIEKIDKERQLVASAAGYDVESLVQWLKRTYSVEGASLFECIQNNSAYRSIDAPPTIKTRYIFEDIPNGLVPVEAMGAELGISTPNITTIINLACSVTDTDYRANGRRFNLEQMNKYF